MRVKTYEFSGDEGEAQQRHEGKQGGENDAGRTN